MGEERERWWGFEFGGRLKIASIQIGVEPKDTFLVNLNLALDERFGIAPPNIMNLSKTRDAWHKSV